jgi:DNA repair photolyase
MLFDIQPSQRLVGIARLAAAGNSLQTKSQVEYFELPSRSLLNRCSSQRMPFAWTINPYRGCEFGCKYCYARYTHEFMGLEDGRLFETRIYAKQHAARLLSQELKRHPRGAIAIGTSTDPYQPAERRFEVTRSILEVLTRESGRTLAITTKSDLILRDIELLDRVRRRNVLHLNITVTTTDAALARKLEPRAPRPDLRLHAVRALTREGFSVGVFASPVMPLLTDSLENLNAVAEAAARACARYFGGGILFLMPCAQAQFFPFLEQEFPDLAKRYRDRYSRRPYLRGEYARLIRERIEQVRANHGLAATPQSYRPEDWVAGPQQPLFG